jgi:hypothetical protein
MRSLYLCDHEIHLDLKSQREEELGTMISKYLINFWHDQCRIIVAGVVYNHSRIDTYNDFSCSVHLCNLFSTHFVKSVSPLSRMDHR